MSWFQKSPDPHKPFRKNEEVVALVDFPGVPAGTQGKVKMSNGISWLRYWVFFRNGVELGQIDGSLLARPKHRQLLEEQIKVRADAIVTREEQLATEQETLLDLFLNPPPEEPAATTSSADTDASVATDSTGSEPATNQENEAGNAAENATAGAEDTAASPESAATPPQPAQAPQGSALVDVPDHLLERSTEARTRLSE